MILLICEEINTAYNTKDLEYLEDLFGGDRLVLDMVVQQDSVKQIKGGKKHHEEDERDRGVSV